MARDHDSKNSKARSTGSTGRQRTQSSSTWQEGNTRGSARNADSGSEGGHRSGTTQERDRYGHFAGSRDGDTYGENAQSGGWDGRNARSNSEYDSNERGLSGRGSQGYRGNSENQSGYGQRDRGEEGRFTSERYDSSPSYGDRDTGAWREEGRSQNGYTENRGYGGYPERYENERSASGSNGRWSSHDNGDYPFSRNDREDRGSDYSRSNRFDTDGRDGGSYGNQGGSYGGQRSGHDRYPQRDEYGQNMNSRNNNNWNDSSRSDADNDRGSSYGSRGSSSRYQEEDDDRASSYGSRSGQRSYQDQDRNEYGQSTSSSEWRQRGAGNSGHEHDYSSSESQGRRHRDDHGRFTSR